ncbi:TlpA disulfide reductase family protein [Bradyrhizobium iriomotense]|uniref:Thiol:disulfide interchange protein n=1 Tax=Bradyrhizobium iriomotense TaxID=441950 RepID=A0ABQ6AVB7_9BRAD|nr:TlpA disulfide reductase family protein [Bradyrhizobium iriomotense]GLR83822.1 thiol:disulfide interchange protein [Bradyrhizobium iriomotense]
MPDAPRANRTGLTRRAMLLAAPALGLAGLHPGRAASEESVWPPVFATGRSQFTVVRPRLPMPPLRLRDLRGKDVVLTAKPGRVTLVNFWATWCAACRLDLPVMASLARSRSDGLDVYAICTDTGDLGKITRYLGGLDTQNLRSYVDAYGAAVAANDPTDAAFRLIGMPITYLIGTSNRIEGYITGAADWLSPPGAALLQFYREQA